MCSYDHYNSLAKRSATIGTGNLIITLFMLGLAGASALNGLPLCCVLCSLSAVFLGFVAAICFTDRAYYAKRRDCSASCNRHIP